MEDSWTDADVIALMQNEENSCLYDVSCADYRDWWKITLLRY